MIDISSVKTETTMDDVKGIAAMAKRFQFICAFTMPNLTDYLVEQLRDEKDVMVGGVVGFPSGTDLTAIKVTCARELIKMGVEEIDMVIQVGALKSGQYDFVCDDVKAVVHEADGLPVKSIIEASYLSDDEIKRASEIVVKAGAAFVKTGTGWGPKPTTVDTIRLIKDAIGDAAQIKAAGGVSSLDTVLEMRALGCNRFGLGVKNAESIMKELYARSSIPWSADAMSLSQDDQY
jgi:deoxyribose-phosphate aldolase